jgi:tol-pal system protein YbgF
MKKVILFSVLLFVLLNSVFAKANIDIESVLLKNRQEVKRIIKNNKTLLEKIERLEQNQLSSEKKIKELFNLLTYTRTSKTRTTVTKKKKVNQKAKRLYNSARNLLLADQYLSAIKKFKQYLGSYPNGAYVADAQYWLAKAYLVKEDYRHASSAFLSFQQKNEKHYKYPNSLFELSKIYLKINKKNEAIRLLKVLIKKHSKHIFAMHGQTLLRKTSARKK